MSDECTNCGKRDGGAVCGECDGSAEFEQRIATLEAGRATLQRELEEARALAETRGNMVLDYERLLREERMTLVDSDKYGRELLRRVAERDARIAAIESGQANAACERCELNRDGFGYQGMLPAHTCPGYAKAPQEAEPAARERLGKWLAAKPRRTWWHGPGHSACLESPDDRPESYDSRFPFETLAGAINDALDVASRAEMPRKTTPALPEK